MNNIFARMSRWAFQLGEVKGARRWLLLAIIITLIAGLCYGVLRLSPYFEGFEQYGYIGAFLIAFVSSISILFPVPGVVIIVTMAAAPEFNWALVALTAGIGGAVGEFTSYLAGYAGRAIVVRDYTERYQWAEGWMRRYGGWAILLFAFTPLPFDLVGVAAGALRYPFLRFILLTMVARIPRSMLECYLGAGLIQIIMSFFGWG